MKKSAYELTNRGLAARVLKQVNDIRMACAIGEGNLNRLPKGLRGSNSRCTVARALTNGWHASVGRYRVHLRHPDPFFLAGVVAPLREMNFENVERRTYSVTFDTTPELKCFIDKFDRGEYPHLIARGA